jgi:hypothetical protein
MMLVVPNNMAAVQDKRVAHKLMMVDTFEDTVVEGTSFEDTVHMLYMVVARMLAVAAADAASADQHMVAHIQSVYTALPVLRPL